MNTAELGTGRTLRWRKIARLSSLIALTVVIGSLIALGISQRRALKSLQDRVDSLEWLNASENNPSFGTMIAAEPNLIQFLPNGLTVNFSEVNFDPSGLRLTGHLGNSTNLWLYTASLKFEARKPMSMEAFLSAGYWERLFQTSDVIGSAQTSGIPLIAPGRREGFTLSIPNVKQTSEGFNLFVQLVGERYAYPN